ncbi:MAG: glycosyltransferase family 4 protein, partial [Nitrospinota bacterium]|nr:glycosyltransferase family 4 protein [Nitrospinota bacterium]
MKICFTVNSSPWSKFKGGGQITVHHLASAISGKGHEVHVLYSKCRSERVKPPEVNYRIHWVRHFNMATINLNIFSFAQTLSALAAQENFNIIHGNSEEAFFSSGVCRKHYVACFFTSHAPFIPRTG